MQRRVFGRRARVARDHVQLRHRHVQLGVLRVFQVQELGLAFAQVHAGQAHVAPDAVVDVHDRVADLQLGQVAHHRLDLARRFLLLLAGAPARTGIQLGLGDEDQVAGARIEQLEAGLQRRHAQRQTGVARAEALEAFDRYQIEPVFAEVLLQRFAPAGRIGADHHARVAAVEVGAQAGQRIVQAAVDGDVGNRRRQLGRRCQRVARDIPAAVRLDAGEELLGAQEQFGRLQDRALAVAFQEAVARLGVDPEAVDGAFDIADQCQWRAVGQVVQQRRRRRRRTAAGSTRCRPRRCRCRCPCRSASVTGRPRSASRQRPRKPVRAASSIGNSRPGSRRTSRTGYSERWVSASKVRIDLDLVAEQVEAIGQGRAHREQVDQAAAHRVFARRHHLRHVRVAGQRQLRLQACFIEALALAEEERVRGQERRRRQAHQRGGGRHHQHVALAVADLVQRGQAFGHQILVRRERVVGQRFPVGQQVAGQLAVGEPRDFIEQALAIAGIGHDDGEHLALGLEREGGNRQRVGVGRTVEERQDETMACFGEVFLEVERHAACLRYPFASLRCFSRSKGMPRA